MIYQNQYEKDLYDPAAKGLDEYRRKNESFNRLVIDTKLANQQQACLPAGVVMVNDPFAPTDIGPFYDAPALDEMPPKKAARGSDLQPQTPAGVREFGTGATRDLDANKLDFEGFLSPLVLERYSKHMHQARKMPDGSMRDSDNWQRGIGRSVYMKSMWRHFFAVWKLHRGMKVTETVNGVEVEKDLETELSALLFNASGMLHEVLLGRDAT